MIPILRKRKSGPNNPVLAAGELGLDTNLNKLKVGDGKTAWSDLPFLAEGVKDRPKEKLGQMLISKYANFRRDTAPMLLAAKWNAWMNENGMTYCPTDDHIELPWMGHSIYMPKDFAEKALVLDYMP